MVYIEILPVDGLRAASHSLKVPATFLKREPDGASGGFVRITSATITRTADLSGTFVFAIEGGLTGLLAGLDPVGVLVVAFLTALGGGLIRDVLIGALPPAAVKDWRYSVTVLFAALAVWILHASILAIPGGLMIALDAAGLALAAIAGTEKALDHDIPPFVAVFVGTVSGAGGEPCATSSSTKYRAFSAPTSMRWRPCRRRC